MTTRIQQLAKLAMTVEKHSASIENPYQSPGLDEEKKKRKKEMTIDVDPGLMTSLAVGAGGLGALGTAYGIASDSQVGRIAKARKEFNPKAFGDRNLLPPNTTGLTYYNRILSPASQLNPFGKPVGDALVALRGNDTLMDLAGIDGYRLKTPKAQQGVSGAAHYRMFAAGPVPAYMHQMKAKYRDVTVPDNIGSGKYPTWMGEKLENFVATEMGEAINPYEFSTKYLPHEKQVKLMQDFHASLTPEEREYRQGVEALDETQYTKQTENYLPKAEMVADVRNTLKDVGITAGGAGAGGVAGHYLHRLFGGERGAGRHVATAAGAGLGGTAAYLGGTTKGRATATKLVNWLKKLTNKEASDMTYIQMLAKTASTADDLRIASGAVAKDAEPLTLKGLGGLLAGGVAGAGTGALAGAGGLAGATVGGLHGMFSDPGEDEEGEEKSRIWAALKGILGGGALGVAGGLAAGAGAVAGGVGGAAAGGVLGKKLFNDPSPAPAAQPLDVTTKTAKYTGLGAMIGGAGGIGLSAILSAIANKDAFYSGYIPADESYSGFREGGSTDWPGLAHSAIGGRYEGLPGHLVGGAGIGAGIGGAIGRYMDIKDEDKKEDKKSLVKSAYLGMLLGGTIGAGIGRHRPGKDGDVRRAAARGAIRGGFTGSGATIGGGIGLLGTLALMKGKSSTTKGILSALLPLLGAGAGGYGGYRVGDSIVANEDKALNRDALRQEDLRREAVESLPESSVEGLEEEQHAV